MQQITRFLDGLFLRMGKSPYAFIASGDFAALGDLYYRFHKGPDIIRLFTLLRGIVERYGGIGSMIEHYYEGDLRKAVWAARADLIGSSDDLLFFFPKEAPASPFKRWSLYARWMVRRDGIDFGLWKFVGETRPGRPAGREYFQDRQVSRLDRPKDAELESRVPDHGRAERSTARKTPSSMTFFSATWSA